MDLYQFTSLCARKNVKLVVDQASTIEMLILIKPPFHGVAHLQNNAKEICAAVNRAFIVYILLVAVIFYLCVF